MQVWSGENGKSWMGTISSGMKYLTCKKYQKRAGEYTYSETQQEFFLEACDCRIIFTSVEVVPQRASSRSSTQAQQKARIITVQEKELEQLKNRVYMQGVDKT